MNKQQTKNNTSDPPLLKIIVNSHFGGSRIIGNSQGLKRLYDSIKKLLESTSINGEIKLPDDIAVPIIENESRYPTPFDLHIIEKNENLTLAIAIEDVAEDKSINRYNNIFIFLRFALPLIAFIFFLVLGIISALQWIIEIL